MNTVLRSLAVLTALVALALFPSAAAADPSAELRLLRISPLGKDVQSTRQIVFQFDQPVVAVGRMARDQKEVPIEFAPEVSCEWRWLNTSSLACQLGEGTALARSTRYRIRVAKGAAGAEAEKIRPAVESFLSAVPAEILTERPRPSSHHFTTWLSPGTPVFYLSFNQEVKADSVQDHVYFRVGEKRYRSALLPRDVVADHTAVGGASRTFKIRPRDELPGGSEVDLYVEPGIESDEGREESVEDRLIAHFATFPEFRFLGVQCCNARLSTRERRCEKGSPVILAPPAASAETRCDPQEEVSLVFSSPVIKDAVAPSLQISPPLSTAKDEDSDPWESVYSFSQLSYVRSGPYVLRMPHGLKPFQEYRLRGPAAEIKDEFGRALPEDVDLLFYTDNRLPRVVFDNDIAYLERDEATHFPVAVQNIDSLEIRFDRLNAKGLSVGQTASIPVDNVSDVSYHFPLRARDLLRGASGIVIGSISSSPPFLRGNTEDNTFKVVVSPYAVHAKLGHFNSLLWVTSLQDGRPVPHAAVTVYREDLDLLTQQPAVLARGRTDAEGIAILPGLDEIDPELAVHRPRWRKKDKIVLKVRVQKGNDLSLVPLIDDLEVEPRGNGGSYIPMTLRQRFGHLKSWGTCPQGIYRLGDTLQYKIFVRQQNEKVLIPPPREGYTLEVVDPLEKVVHRVEKVTLSPFGAVDGEFVIPQNGAVGNYRFALKVNFAPPLDADDYYGEGDSPAPETRRLTLYPMSVLVSDFTPAPFRVSTEIKGTFFRQNDTVQVQSAAKLHSGGTYGNAPVRVTAEAISRPITSPDPRAAGYFFENSGLNSERLYQDEDTLDGDGVLDSEFVAAPKHVIYGRLAVETTVRDDRGKAIANEVSLPFSGRDLFVGVRFGQWAYSRGSSIDATAFVITDEGKIVPGVEVHFLIERNETLASRVKGEGNAYITHYEQRWIREQECEAVSGEEAVTCAFTAAKSGSHRVKAKIVDTQGREHTSTSTTWVFGGGDVIWEAEAGNRLEVTPEAGQYRVGDKARFFVQNPFPGARALISLERYGVIRQWTEEFPDSSKVLEVPITADLIPGFYLSVVLTSPRVARPTGEGEIDLGKPAMRMGYAKIDVLDPYKELSVTVKADREVYRPRERVKLELSARTRHGQIVPAELSVAVLDESVFDLITAGTDYFDPYKGFYRLDPLDLQNFNPLLQLIGKRSFKRKGAHSGGDGSGAFGFRSLFRFLAYWNPTVPLDRTGKGAVEFDLPDNLTGWRILVLGATAGDRMGLGQGNIRVSQPTEIRGALPNQVIAGDRFEAAFVVTNRTDHERTLDVAVETEGSSAPRETQQVSVKPFERATVKFPVETVAEGEIRFRATAGDAEDRDSIAVQLPVKKRFSLETGATYGSSDDDRVEERIAFPPDIRTDVGRVSIVLSPSVIGGVDRAFRYMRDYPYLCWEQRLTKGVMAAHFQHLQQYLSPSTKWGESESLPAKTLSDAASFQAPNGGMTYFTPQDEYADPYLSAYTAIAFTWLARQGYAIPPNVQERLEGYLVALLRQNELPTFYTAGMASTARGVALAALASRGKIEVTDLDAHVRHLPQMSLFGKAHYLTAAAQLDGGERFHGEALRQILAQSNETGGKISFQESIDTVDLQRLLTTPVRDNCAVLSALLARRDGKVGQLDSSYGLEPYKLVRSLTQARKNRAAWINTQENMFCLAALIDYSAAYESKPPQGVWSAAIGAEPMGTAKFADLRDAPLELHRAIDPVDVGTEKVLSLTRNGSGRIYYGVRLEYAPKSLPSESVNSGIEIRREYSVERSGKWEVFGDPPEVKQGDLVRVDLYLSLPAARHFVVIDDAIPGGLETVNRDLKTASRVDAEKGEVPLAGGSYWYRFYDWVDFASTRWSFYHRELRHDSARFYSDYLPPGNYHVAYVAQAIASGKFVAQPAHAEEMYDPDVYGNTAPTVLTVSESQ